MRVLFVCLLFAILPCSGKDHQLTAPMVLYTGFQAAPSAPVMLSVQNELDEIMSPVGIRFEWRSLSAPHNGDLVVKLAVIHFKGHCDVSGLTLSSQTPGVLGLTHVTEGVILSFSDIDCDHILSFIQPELLSERADDRDRMFGRAIARVLAHELYHIMANTAKHGSSGIAKSRFLASELVASDFHFDKRDCIVLRKSTVISNLENVVNASIGSPPADLSNR